MRCTSRCLAGSALSGLIALLLTACAINPVTGKRQLALISEAQELAIGRQAAAEVRSTIGLVDDGELQAYVQQVGMALARDSERPQLPWTFAIVDDPTPNAFALPGGHIFLTRGMMNLMSSEAELASVLGHEIGHVTARHSVTAISQQQLAQLGLGLGGILFPASQPFAQALGAGLDLLFLRHGRDAERQADQLGFAYALNEGYAVAEMADVFLALQRTGGEQRSALPSWLTTHPAPGERIDRVREMLAQVPLDRAGSRSAAAEYLNTIDGLVYGQNPRQGFFREGRFFHPDLRFRFDLPSAWATQNIPEAVMGLSPRQDAVVQLTLAGDVGAAQAARQFSSQGVRVLRSGQEPINGMPAIVTLFDAATPQGAARGVVAHIAYGGRTYQLLAYTSVQRYASYDGLFAQVLRSFAPLTDRSILGIQPQRLDVVRLTEDMSVAEFSRRYDSAIPAGELAIINHVEGPDSRLEAGMLVKRVVG